VNVKLRVGAVPPADDVAATTIGEVDEVLVGVPVMVPAAPLKVKPAGNAPDVIL
jgi:hypothetical protein